EIYMKKIQIESRVIGDLALNHIIPTALKYQNLLIQNVEGMMNIKMKSDSFRTQVEMIREISGHITAIKTNIDKMVDSRKKANIIQDDRQKEIAYCDKVKAFFDPIRYHVDKLEML